VWGRPPLFVQQTVVPGATVKVAGENENSAIEIMVSPGSQTTPGRPEEAWPEAGRTTSRANSASESPFPISIAATILLLLPSS
jgi:hypothetical protein